MCFCDLPEAMKDKAMEAERLFRRGCLQYLEDFGLSHRTDTIINDTFPLVLMTHELFGSMPSPVSELPSHGVELGDQNECREHCIHYLTTNETWMKKELTCRLFLYQMKTDF